ncbi:hypothetical protein MVLG_06640 [Microbotryum lychnidis-dioicae p1A1 Lamole]|uniref:Ubiquitin-like protease family profile domain-containing protein n=1 Tax=Microbotryum lychnidis-dioicae (strain p1A1 Lamole / MvSl-1064) TaxID=683840 RepID=U5HHX0_USTV1|nr:hypothetical protein MVLG_06640 [Microbotryum lychnidis-dioicae p1A1 Lamole]|eukprot:KDE02829.1 hypothetical protein MVLG_06640 [Microbotryum lychnidis-dioicae p1A1 Lamole]
MTPTEFFLSDDDHPTQTKDGDLDSESWSPIAHLTSAKLLMDAQLPSSDDHLGVQISMDIPRRLENELSFPYPSKKVRDALSSAARSQAYKGRSLAVGEHRLALGTTQIWNDLDKAKKAQGLLRATVKRIARFHACRDKDRDMKKQLEVGLLSLPWRDSFWGFDCSLVTYESLIGMLSNNWLGESVVNFLIACVIEASSKPSERDESQVYGLIPSDYLSTALAAPIIKTSLEPYQFESALVRDFHLPYTGLSAMADYIENNPETIWFLPICHHSHWFMGPRTRLPATFTATGDPLKDSTNLVQTRDRKPRDVAAAPVNKPSGASGSGVSPHTAKPLTTSTTQSWTSRVVVSPGPADDPHSGPTHLHLPKALHESQSLTSDKRHDHPVSTTAALATLDSHSSTTSAKSHQAPTTPRRNDKRPARSESKAVVQDAFFLTDGDDDDDDDEDKTFEVMHSKPQYSTPYFDGPSNPPNAASGQDGPSVSAATIGARLERVEIQLARLVDVLTAPSLDNIKSDVGSAKIFVSTPFLCKHHGAAPCSRLHYAKAGWYQKATSSIELSTRF